MKLENEQKKNEPEFIINGQLVSLNEFQTIRRDPKIKLIEISKNNYKTLEMIYG